MSIVGIIAILTIPNVVRNIFKDSYYSKALATQENLQKAVKSFILSERLVDIEGSALFSNKGSFLNNYLKITKDCGNSGTNCFAASYKISSSESENLSGLYSAQDKYYTIMNSGAALGLLTGGDVPSNQVYAIVDANGKSAPNVFGVDMYAFSILPDGNVTDLSDGITIAMGDEGGDDYEPENPGGGGEPSGGEPGGGEPGGGEPGGGEPGGGNQPGGDDPGNDEDDDKPCQMYDGCSLCMVNLGYNYSPVDCQSSNSGSADYQAYCTTAGGNVTSNYKYDYWAGAKKACAQQNMRLISETEATQNLRTDIEYSLPCRQGIPSHEWFWTSAHAGTTKGQVYVGTTGIITKSIPRGTTYAVAADGYDPSAGPTYNPYLNPQTPNHTPNGMPPSAFCVMD